MRAYAALEALTPATCCLSCAHVSLLSLCSLMVAYAPWAEPRLARKPGAQPLDPFAWLERGGDTAAQMARRRDLIDTQRDTVLAALPDSAPAQAELRDAVAAHTGEALPDDPSPLGQVGRMVQEDFCLLEQHAPDEEYRLTAAILCFPSRWSLAEKIGHPLTMIHGPVPDYTDDLARRVNRLFDGVRAGKPLWRANWTVHPTSELHQPSGTWRQAEDGPLHIRVERQTFLRLPRSQAVVFGIRTHIDPLEALTLPEAKALRAALAPLNADEIEYRGGVDLHRATLDALAARGA